MTINTERLKTDAAYWDEYGAKNNATHYCKIAKKFIVAPDPEDQCSNCIPRPTKPAAPEWDGYVDADDDTQEWGGKGWPPAGRECEFCDYSENEANRWKRCLLLGLHDGDAVWLYLIDANEYHTETNVDPKQFRPIRTKEQRDRDDLAEVLANAFDATYEDCQEAADAAIAAGWTKP